MPSSVEQRFWKKVDKTGTCWLWTGARNTTGYGVFRYTGKALVAHHRSYEWCVGHIPEGLQLDHICHVKHCVNPDHLKPVTAKKNSERRKGAYCNSSSGIRGVTWNRNLGKWQVEATHNYIKHYGGMFDDLASAQAAAIALRENLYGSDEFRR